MKFPAHLGVLLLLVLLVSLLGFLFLVVDGFLDHGACLGARLRVSDEHDGHHLHLAIFRHLPETVHTAEKKTVTGDDILRKGWKVKSRNDS